MTMLMERFDLIKTADNRTAYLVPCRRCSESIHIVAAGQDFPPEVVAKKVTQKGWVVDKKGRATCPACQKPTKEKVMKPNAAHITEAFKQDGIGETPLNVTPIPPRSPTPTDLRRIMREIDDNWDEARQRYTGATTDQSIADKLNVPRAWVAAERVRAFGDQMRNEAAEQALGELKNLRADAKKAMQRAFDAAASIEVHISHIETMIVKYDKLLG